MSTSGEPYERRRRLAVDVTTIAGAVVMGAALWLPWHYSGDWARNAFDLLIAADRLDIGRLASVWRWLLPFVPALVAVSWIAMILRRRRLLFAAVGAVAALVGVPALVGAITDDGRESGEVVALVGLTGSTAGALSSRFGRRLR